MSDELKWSTSVTWATFRTGEPKEVELRLPNGNTLCLREYYSTLARYGESEHSASDDEIAAFVKEWAAAYVRSL